jgi:CO/xanthine dehydrogenase Mo-binding subunit
MVMSAEKLAFTSEAELRLAMRGNLCRCTGYQAIAASILAGKQARTGKDETQTTQELEARSHGSSHATQHTLSPVGKNIPKQDGVDIVTGKPVYTSDWVPTGLLHMQVLRSPHAHARILHIDTAQAQAFPGVHLILTHADVPRRPYTTAGHAEPVPDPLDHFMLDTKVRFIGDRVAAVVADSVAIAAQACQLITVEYEILPHVIDPVAAMGWSEDEVLPWHTSASSFSTPVTVIHDEPDAQSIPDADHNIAGVVAFAAGNLEQAFAEADVIVETSYRLPAVQHTHLEPHIATSWLEEDGTLVVRSSTQVPFHCQRMLSELLDLPKDKIRVYKAKLGGGFGNKQELLCEDLCALATLKTGQPVQWEFSRLEEFTSTNSRHAEVIRLKTGAKADGTLVAQEMVAIANTGAYGNHGQTVVFLTGYVSLGLYRCPNRSFQGYAVYTNTMPAGAFRGYGATQGCFAVECQLDEIAAKLNLDPLDLRRTNIIRPGDIVALGRSDDHFNLIGGYALEECITKVVEKMGDLPEPPPVVAGHLRRGVGFAVSMQGSGLSKIHHAGVTLSLEPDGRFCLRTGSVDVGTGSDTTLRQIAAQVLGVAVGQIDIITADTHATPFDAGSYASATLYISGQAVKQAAELLRDRLQTAGIDLTAAAHATHPASLPLPIVAEVTYAADESTLTFAVQGVEVEVDMETGKVQVLRSVQAIDLGRAINPRICVGQATGGSAMGIGYALMEELLLDDRGKILNPGFRTYRIPTAADVPPMQVMLIETEDPYGPFGAKGVGEITTNCMAPAIANAIAHATGIRLTQLPMTPERVWNAIHA